jgi:hypothetical protein
MSHRKLREVAKFASGLVAADLLTNIWLWYAGLYPLTAFGITFTESAFVPTVIFDLVLIAMLMHFGWNVKLPVEAPKERVLLMLAGSLLLFVALAHLLRIAFDVELTIGAFMVPEWLSWLGIAITAYLGFACFHFIGKRGRA